MSKSLTLKEARQAHVRYVNTYDRTPTPDELVAFIAIEEQREYERFEVERRREDIRLQREEEQARFVRIQFHGHARRYCYELPAHFHGAVQIGDYVSVYSPLSDQTELVRVVELGRGGYVGGTKLCYPIDWSVRDN